MVNSSINIRVVLLPVLALLAKEVLWNISVFFINPVLLNIPAQLVWILILLTSGFIADSLYGYETAEAAIYGAITGVIGSILSGVIISPIFYRMLFYSPGIPIFSAIYDIVSSGVLGGILGFIGSLLSSFDQLNTFSEKLESINDGFWGIINEKTGKSVDIKSPQTSRTNPTSPISRDPEGVASTPPLTVDEMRSLGLTDEMIQQELQSRVHSEDLNLDPKLTQREIRIIIEKRVSDDGLLPGLTAKETQEVLDSSSDDDLGDHPELTRRDIRIIIENRISGDRLLPGLTAKETQEILDSSIDDDLGDHPELTEKDIREIIEKRIASAEYEIKVEKSEKPIIPENTQAAIQEVHKKSEMSRSSGLINGIKRIFQKLVK